MNEEVKSQGIDWLTMIENLQVIMYHFVAEYYHGS